MSEPWYIWLLISKYSCVNLYYISYSDEKENKILPYSRMFPLNKKKRQLKRQCLKSTATQQYFVAYLVLKTKYESMRSHSYLPVQVLLCTWLIPGTQRGLSRGSLSGVGGDCPCRTFISPEISYWYQARGVYFRHPSINYRFHFFPQKVENQIHYPQGQFLLKMMSPSNHVHRVHKNTSKKPPPHGKGLLSAVALL